MSMSRNLWFGVSSAIWSALVALAVVPFYLTYLGVESYGLIGIYSAAYALFSLLDVGLSPAINREVARCAAAGNMRPARELLHTLSIVYWSTAAVLVVVAISVMPLLGQRWLTTSTLPLETLGDAFMLIGLIVACRWPHGLYHGALIGAERMAVVSTTAMAMTLISSVGAVAVLAWIAPTIEAFFVWQAAAGLLHVLVLRMFALRAVGREPLARFSVGALRSIWRFSAGTGAIAAAALVLTQVDKVVLSGVLPLPSFGEYMLAAVAVSSVYVVVNPVFNVIYPRFTALVACGAQGQLEELYRSGTRLLTMALFPLCMVLAIFAKDALLIWTGNQQLAEDVGPVLSLLVIGAALHSVMYFPYALQLAYGRTRLGLKIGVILLMVSAPLTALLAWRYGTIGGAAANVFLYAVYLLLGAWMTHRTLLTSIGWAWLLRDVCSPLLICVSIGVLGSLLLTQGTWVSAEKIGLACLCLLLAWLGVLAAGPRSTVQQLLAPLTAKRRP